VVVEVGDPEQLVRFVERERDGLVEDGLIAHTFVEFAKTGDVTWPLLVPMVKSVVAGMTAAQAAAADRWGIEVDGFVTTGASKRGWTTWLSAAIDERVKGLVLVDPAIYEGGGSPSWARPLLTTPQARRIGPLLVRNIRDWGYQFGQSAWHDRSKFTDEIWTNYSKPLQTENWDRALWELTQASRPLNLDQRLDELGVPVLVTLQGDDLFLDELEEPWRAQVLAEIAGLASQLDAVATAMASAERICIWAGISDAKARLAVFQQCYAAQIRAAEAVMPYIHARQDKAPAPVQAVQVVMGHAQQPGDGARVVEAVPQRPGFAPPPMPGETEQNQGVDE
jgi:pimeloyl-ACP methyl ester carboxylesterase